MQITSVEGRLIRDPYTGREIKRPVTVDDNDPFYLRAIAAGDVTDDPVKVAEAQAAADAADQAADAAADAAAAPAVDTKPANSGSKK